MRALSGAYFKALGDFLQQGVPGHVAVQVIDCLEAIQIDQNEPCCIAELFACRYSIFALRDCAPQCPEKGSAIGQLRQAV